MSGRVGFPLAPDGHVVAVGPSRGRVRSLGCAGLECQGLGS